MKGTLKINAKYVTLLAFNFLAIKTTWQIGLHEPKPLVGLSSSYNTYAALTEEHRVAIGFASLLTGYLGVWPPLCRPFEPVFRASTRLLLSLPSVS